ncbi:MAG: hypothetical protein ACO1Q7_20005 [Gemmatimonas sp.]
MRGITSRRTSVWIIGLALGALTAFSHNVQAQVEPSPKPIRIPDAPTCPTCSVTLRQIAILGAQEGPGELDGLPTAIREDRQGRFWVIPGWQEPPRVYSAKGEYLSTVGRKGEGPGEFTGAVNLTPLPGDSMLAVDQLSSRATVIGPDLKPHRFLMYPNGSRVDLVLRWPTSVVASGWVAARGQQGLPLHHVSLAARELKFLQPFSPDTAKWARQSDLWSWIQAAEGRGGFWSVNTYRYRFTQWSPERTVVADYERIADWFPPSDRRNAAGNPSTPPMPSLIRILSAADSRVWAIAKVPSPNWRRAWPVLAPGRSDVDTRRIAFENLYNSVVEEIDLKTARVLSRTHIAKLIIAGLEGNRVATYELNALGVPRIVIYALESSRTK